MTHAGQPEGSAFLWELLDHLDVGVFRVDNTTGQIVGANEAIARMFGFPSARDVLGTPVIQHYADPKERAEAAARLFGSSTAPRPQSVRLEAERRRRDTGEPVHVLMCLVPTYDADGNVTALDGLMEDIGHRKEAEKAFRSGSERFRVLFEASPVGMAVTAPDGRILRANAALCRFTGRSELELEQMRLPDLVHPDDRPNALAADRSANDAASGTTGGSEWRFPDPAGNVRWGHVTSSQLVEDGAVHSGVLLIQDVTGRKSIEIDLLRLEKLEAVGLLAGGLAHDFNNALAVILGNVALARTLDGTDGKVSHLLIRAEEAVQRAQRLTQRLITFARGGSPLCRPVLVQEIAREAARAVRGTGVSVDVSAASDVRYAAVDAAQIGRVFYNLFSNAADAMGGTGTIRVRVQNVRLRPGAHAVLRAGDYVRVQVTDHGVGIASEHLAHIFDAYFSTKPEGEGLGLATVLSVIRRHGGHIEVHSVEGRGATFTMHLPASDPAQTPAVPGAPSAPSGDETRVLLMDDDDGVLQVARGMLEHLGYTVMSTVDGAQAVAQHARGLAQGRPYGVVILDLTVRGGMGGLEALERMRQAEPGVCAIVSSGYSTDPVMSRYREYGFAGVVPKPYSLGQLADALASVRAGACRPSSAVE